MKHILSIGLLLTSLFPIQASERPCAEMPKRAMSTTAALQTETVSQAFPGLLPSWQTMSQTGATTMTAGKRRNPVLVDDLGFMRRVWLDLAGRLPSLADIEAFQQDPSPDKRSHLIETLLASDAYAARWTAMYRDLFGNRLVIYSCNIRNNFYDYMREAVSTDRPWNDVAREILSVQGEGFEAPTPYFVMAHRKLLLDEFHLDYLDNQVNYITETMLGIRTECISCHDGAQHLEEVNTGLTQYQRSDFWAMAAFLSKNVFWLRNNNPDDYATALFARLSNMNLVDLDDPDLVTQGGTLIQENRFADGEYTATSEMTEGTRPPRDGGIIPPAYLFTGEQPRPGETRREALARMITSDRQFARNMVNRVWAHLFGEGFVEPLNGWDLGRIDQVTAQANSRTVQPRNAEVMEALTDFYIDHDYKLKPLIRYICNLEIYQWDYERDPVQENTAIAFWKSRQRVRRLEAEAIVDSMRSVLGLNLSYLVTGKADKGVSSTWDMPDRWEPSMLALIEKVDLPGFNIKNYGYDTIEEFYSVQGSTQELLSQLGRGDEETKRSNDTHIPALLTLLNADSSNFWLADWRKAPQISSLVQDLNRNRKTPEEVTRDLFLQIMVRQPKPEELTALVHHLNTGNKGEALANIVWALFNHPDFLYK